jgi:hypothetical protein
MTPVTDTLAPRSPVWPWAALVTVGGVIATAHGLYVAATEAGQPDVVAVLYPLIIDGLALVAYVATRRLSSAVYPWLVVVIAAGLSGLAQGVNLAKGEEPWTVEWWLRFGVGAAPAVAALTAAHLLWLVGRPRVETGDREDAPTDAGGPGDHPKSPNPGPSAPALNGNGHGGGSRSKGVPLQQVMATAVVAETKNKKRPSRPELATMAGCSLATAGNARRALGWTTEEG